MSELRRVALVTGGARGIGAATGKLLAANGWSVVLFDRCKDDPALGYSLATDDDLAAAVAACGDAAIGATGDVRELDDVRAAVALAQENFGGLDAVVAAAGVIIGGPPAWEFGQEQWDAQLGINVTGVWNTVRAAVPALLKRPQPRQGRVVAVASAAGLQGNPRLAAYNASKSAVVGLVKGLAADLAGTGVTANAVCPGSTRTAMLDHSAEIYDLQAVEEFEVHHLLGRLLDPSEQAEAIAWLLSPGSSAMTGAVVPVDAGMTA